MDDGLNALWIKLFLFSKKLDDGLNALWIKLFLFSKKQGNE